MATALLLALIQVSPSLVAEIIGILHTNGSITAAEVAAFLVELKGSTGVSFFPTLPKVAVVPNA
jgi:hypothetical protein